MKSAGIKKVYELAKQDPRVVFIASDVTGNPIPEMREAMPDRYFMEGICEGGLIGMAAGMAMNGFIPYVTTIATFLTRRCYEQIVDDLCLHNLPVRLLPAGGGLVYAGLGPTHQSTEDYAIMRALPNMTVVAPADANEMGRFMDQTLDHTGPIYVRIGAGGDPIVSRDDDGFEIGKAITLRKPGLVTIIASGIMVSRAIDAADRLEADGISCGVINMHTIKPLDGSAVVSAAQKSGLIVTLEEHMRAGGLGSAVLEAINDQLDMARSKVLRLGIPDVFAEDYGFQDDLLEQFGLQGPQVAATIKLHVGTSVLPTEAEIAR